MNTRHDLEAPAFKSTGRTPRATKKLPFAGARLLAAVLAAQSLLLACGGEQPSGEPTEPTPPTAARSQRDELPTLTLSDGKRVVLDPLDLWDELSAQFPPPPETALDEGAEYSVGAKSARPARVDLRDLQTPIRDQGDRGTCVAFATNAALEAAYLRERGVRLDLSEQYANHVQKMAYLSDTATDATERESQLGAWGGSFVGYQLGWLFRLKFGLPEESVMTGIDSSDPSLTYLPWADYENTDQPGDNPRTHWRDPSLTQRQADAWNLNKDATTYMIPGTKTLTNFPRIAPESAVYGAARVRAIPATLAAIRDELAAGREVAFGAALTKVRDCVDEDGDALPEGDPCYAAKAADEAAQYADGVWHPLTTDWGGHAMLIVGYDDAMQAFIVKNSWGTDAGRGRPVEAAAGTSGFIYMSYEWISKIRDTYVVLETRDPSAFENNQPFLGKWQVETDLFFNRSELAVYHLPGAFPSEALAGQRDRRIGTIHTTNYFGSEVSWRVNGSLRPHEMRAHFESLDIERSYEATSGGTGIVALRVDDETLAGFATRPESPEVREPFFATLGDYPAMQSARETDADPAPIDFFGSWRIVGAGLDGVIELTDDIRNGTYRPDDASSEITGVELEINPRTYISDPDDPCFVRITVPTSPAVTLDGLLMCQTDTPARRALITGIGDEIGLGDERGFYAYRELLDPAVIIQTPTDGSELARGRQSVYFRARTVGISGAPVIRWTSDVDGFLGEGTSSFPRVDLSFGTHVIEACADAPGGTVCDSVVLTITNDAPTVDIVEPSGVKRCVDEPINFLAASQDLNNTPTFDLPESAIEWYVAGGAPFGVGHAVTASFPEGGYTIVVRATDEQGEFSEDSINLYVEPCFNNAPTPTIIQPGSDSGVNESQFSYDGYDSARGQWYTDVTFVGTATDLEDGTLPDSELKWSTNRSDVQSASLGTGGSVTVRLYSNSCFGTWHEVKLTVTDSGGKKRDTVRRVYIWTLC